MPEAAHFGEGWDGPGTKEATPSGTKCVDCNERITDEDQGYFVRIDYGLVAVWKPQHRHHRRDA